MLPKFLRPEVFPYASVEVIPAPTHRVICSWCTTLITAGALPASHGICPACIAQFEQPTVSDVERTIEEAQRAGHTCRLEAEAERLELLDDDADDRDELCGSTCGANCGYCGRCS